MELARDAHALAFLRAQETLEQLGPPVIALEARAHRLEGAAEPADLVVGQRRDGLCEVAARDALGGARENEERPEHAARRTPREDRGEREEHGRDGEHPPAERDRGRERVGSALAYDDAPGKEPQGREGDRVLAHAARERPAALEERQQKCRADGRRPSGPRIGRRDDLAHGVDELGREPLPGLEGRQEGREGRKRRIQARAGEAGRLPALIHERNEEEQAARTVRERREGGGRAAPGSHRLPRGRQVEEMVLKVPAGGLLPQDLAARTQEEHAGEKTRVAIRAEEGRTARGAVGLDAAAIETLEVAPEHFLDVLDGAAGEDLLVAQDALGEVVEGARNQEPEDDERREDAEPDEKKRPRLQGILNPEALVLFGVHGFGGASGAGRGGGMG